MKIITYNVNGIRAAIKKGFYDWIAENDFDVICIQETKAQPEQVDTSTLLEMGYSEQWHSAVKKGYSGVATYSKLPVLHHEIGLGIEEIDYEGRVLRSDIGDFSLFNCYFPSGTSGSIRQDVKYAFLDKFYQYIENFKKEQPNIIVVGDYNIAHTEMDIHNPKSNKKNSGFLPEERAWMSKWFDSGFEDAYRKMNPETQKYSWWSYRANARANNKGWRIDYQSVSAPMGERIVSADYLNDVKHSDHCPMILELK